MSSNLKVSAELELRGDKFTRPAREATQAMNQLGAGGQRAMGQVATGANTASISVKQTAAQINAARTATLGMAGSVAGLAASFVGLEASISNIPKRINAIKKAEVGLQRAQDLLATQQLTLKRIDAQLEKARITGKKTTAELALIEEKRTITVQKLSTATEDLSAKQEDLNLKHSDYQDTLKLFTTSIATTALTTFTSITIMLTQSATQADMTTGAFVRMKFATLANSKAITLLRTHLGFLGPNLAAARANLLLMNGALKVSRFSLLGLKMSIKGVWLALGPIGWAIIGITAAFEIWHNNIFGVQEAIAELWEWLKMLVPQLKVLEQIAKTVFPEAQAEVAEFNEEVKEGEEGLSDFNDGIDDTANGLGTLGNIAGSTTTTLSGLNSKLGNTANSIISMQQALSGKGIRELDERVLLLTGNLQYLTKQGIDPLSAEWRQARNEIVPELEAIGTELYETFGEDRFSQFANSINKFGLGFEKSFEKINQSIHKTEKQMDSFKKKQKFYNKDSGDTSGVNGRTILGFRGNPVTVSGFDAMGNPFTKTFRSRILSKRTIPKGGDAFQAIREGTRYANSIINKKFHDKTPSTSKFVGRVNRKRQQLARRRKITNDQKLEAGNLNEYFGYEIFGVISQWANGGRTVLTPTKQGRQILQKLGLNTNTAKLLKEARVSLEDFIGVSASFPTFGTTSKIRIIHNGRRVTNRQWSGPL